MAKLIWTEPSLNDLDLIAEYIAIDNPRAASNYVQKVFTKVERLMDHPDSGKRVRELPKTPYREIVIPPCRIFYKHTKDKVYMLHIMRGEQMLRRFMLEQR